MPAMPPEDHIQTLNALSLQGFRFQIWSPHTCTRDSPHPAWAPTLESSSTISSYDLHSCFQLIESTSSKQYAESSLGWHPARKRKEMRLPDLKYLMVKSKLDSMTPGGMELDSQLRGFVSFMLTYEDGIEVIYCYELHLAPEWRRMGMGKFLMAQVEDVGRKAGVKKAMLTVFRANRAARGFYEKMGYEEDEYSPRSKKLRGGVVKEADYIILSKPLTDHTKSIDVQNPADVNDNDIQLNGSKSRKRKGG